jgi:hypothetical protein
MDRWRGHVLSSFESEHQVHYSSPDRSMGRQTRELVISFEDVPAGGCVRKNDYRVVAVNLLMRGLKSTFVTEDVGQAGQIVALAEGTPFYRFLLIFGVRVC